MDKILLELKEIIENVELINNVVINRRPRDCEEFKNNVLIILEDDPSETYDIKGTVYKHSYNIVLRIINFESYTMRSSMLFKSIELSNVIVDCIKNNSSLNENVKLTCIKRIDSNCIYSHAFRPDDAPYEIMYRDIYIECVKYENAEV